MRPYRGKQTSDGNWAYGWYVECYGGYYIVSTRGDITHKKQVEPATVGQQIGRQDKNSKEIYTGLNNSGDNNGGDIIRQTGAKGQLRWDNYLFMYVIQTDVRAIPFDAEDLNTEIIGNIHDNLEG